MLTLLLIGILSSSAHALTDTSMEDPYAKIETEAKRCKFEGECGWWWGFLEEQKQNESKDVANEPKVGAQTSDEKKPEECKSKDTWDLSCGFVDPKDDFDFMVLQRDKLSQAALMNSADQNSVMQFQKYMVWLVDAGVAYSRTWEYNMVQDTQLNPYAQHPISRFGLKATFQLFKDYKKNIFEEIASQDGVFIFWSKESCAWCHIQGETILSLSKITGIPAYNISLEGNCIDGFNGEYCRSESELNYEAAKQLKVAVVPDLFLLLDSKKPEQNGWVRVSTGIEDLATIQRRVYTFFEAVRSASKDGLAAAANAFKDEKRPAATFDPKYYKPNNLGGTKVDEE